MSLKELRNYPDINFIGGMRMEDMKEQLVKDFRDYDPGAYRKRAAIL